tara:strand:- start:471 stop:1001 length:531 start_codon:yes stop_codon:yes gene_type:complete
MFFLDSTADELCINSILDFGCASGATVFKLKSNNPKRLVYGIDINKKAVEKCVERFNKNFSEGHKFTDSFDIYDIKEFFNNSDNLIDLVIFDRVLYCLDERQIKNIIGSLAPITKYIFIDDFYSVDNDDFIGYAHRDWSKILGKYQFEERVNRETVYQPVKYANARTLLYQNQVFK